MTTKLWNKLTEIVKQVTEDHESHEDIMDNWASKKSEVMKVLSGPSTKGRKKKDPNAPKKGKTGYIFFCSDKRDEVKKENPDMKATEVTSELGARWNKLSTKEKKKYEELAVKDKERYEKEMEDYTPPSDEELTELNKKSKRTKKDPNEPKRPRSSYLYFCKQERENVQADNPALKGVDITVELGRRWRELSEDEKKPFEEEALKDKERYLKAKEDYSPTTEVQEKAKPKKEVKKAEKSKPKKAEKSKPKKEVKKAEKSKPKKETKKAQTKKAEKSQSFTKTPGYEKFVQESKERLKEENPKWGARKLVTEINKQWKELGPEDKEAYELDVDSDSSSEEEMMEED